MLRTANLVVGSGERDMVGAGLGIPKLVVWIEQRLSKRRFDLSHLPCGNTITTHALSARRCSSLLFLILVL